MVCASGDWDQRTSHLSSFYSNLQAQKKWTSLRDFGSLRVRALLVWEMSRRAGKHRMGITPVLLSPMTRLFAWAWYHASERSDKIWLDHHGRLEECYDSESHEQWRQKPLHCLTSVFLKEKFSRGGSGEGSDGRRVFSGSSGGSSGAFSSSSHHISIHIASSPSFRLNGVIEFSQFCWTKFFCNYLETTLVELSLSALSIR